MYRACIRWAAVSLAAAVSTFPAAPASATVHEIVGQWCSGHDHLEPPGLSGGSNANNFAQPLFANGAIAGVVPFPDGPESPGFLVEFNFEHPAAKVVGTGEYVVIGTAPDGSPIYLELIEADPSFPAFQRCPRLAG